MVTNNRIICDINKLGSDINRIDKYRTGTGIFIASLV